MKDYRYDKKELLQKLSEIEWDDFEGKAAQDKHNEESEKYNWVV